MKKVLYIFICFISVLFLVESVSAQSLINTLDTNFFGNLDVVKCGNVELPALVPDIIRTIVNIIKIATPIVLIIMGMLDFTMAIISSDEKKIGEGKNKFIRRLIAAGVLFFVITIVQFLVGVIAPEEANGGILDCIDCMVNDASKCN